MGAAQPIESTFAISQVEREEDKDSSFPRENWQHGLESRARGAAWLDRLYLHNINPINDVFAAHKDFSM
ncbi:hypothetical protein VTO42DRAFT_830 [Malbranchea cinnamomea]